ncbi:MAG: hypothetical protein MRQ07_03875 [Candidatus Midichloria sp.]|nr:hypothetical protein [Candidatus Midichloria sp.]
MLVDLIEHHISLHICVTWLLNMGKWLLEHANVVGAADSFVIMLMSLTEAVRVAEAATGMGEAVEECVVELGETVIEGAAAAVGA